MLVRILPVRSSQITKPLSTEFELNWNGVLVLFLKRPERCSGSFSGNSDQNCCVDKSASIPGLNSEAKIKYCAIGICYCTILGISLLDTCTGVPMNSTIDLLSKTHLRVYLSHRLTQNVGSVQ